MIVAGFIILGIGALFLILGIIFMAVGKATWKCTGTTTGQIVDMCYNAYDYNHGGTGNKAVGISTGDGGVLSRCPIFEYQVKGITYRRANNVSYNKGQIEKKMNRQVSVSYNPENPEEATLGKHSLLSVVGLVFALIGGVFEIVAGIFMMIAGLMMI